LLSSSSWARHIVDPGKAVVASPVGHPRPIHLPRQQFAPVFADMHVERQPTLNRASMNPNFDIRQRSPQPASIGQQTSRSLQANAVKNRRVPAAPRGNTAISGSPLVAAERRSLESWKLNF
jgi:hypothetical protein